MKLHTDNSPTSKLLQDFKDKNYWIKETNLSKENKKEVSNSDIIIIPKKGYGKFSGYLFPDQTEQLYNFIKQKAKDKYKIEICINDEDYKELALHDETIFLGTFLVITVVLPFLNNLLTSYIFEKLMKSKKSNRVNLDIIIEDKSLRYHYQGPIQGLEKSLDVALKSFNKKSTTVEDKEQEEIKQNAKPLQMSITSKKRKITGSKNKSSKKKRKKVRRR